jgi:hypothetical protein
MTQRISTYLDTLWGAETVPWSMYYLNGQDNSMILISTLPLKDLSPGLKRPPWAASSIPAGQKCCSRRTPLMNVRASLPAPSGLAKRSLFYPAHHLQPARTSGDGGGLRFAD